MAADAATLSLPAPSTQPAVMTEKSEAESADTAAAGESWFSCSALATELHLFGFRLAPGGTHLARTLMLAELGRVLEAARDPSQDDLTALVLDHNILHKQTGSARRLSLRHLRELYGVGAAVPITRAMVALWAKAKDGQPMLALLLALAREPLLRDSAEIILPERIGSVFGTTNLAEFFEQHYPGRYTSKMLRSLSQNCASSWTQSGHLAGKVRKVRVRPAASPAAAAYAALLGSLAGLGGPALLAAPWIEVLDRSKADALALLRKAEGDGLLRLRAGGDVIEIEVRRHMAAALGIPELADH